MRFSELPALRLSGSTRRQFLSRSATTMAAIGASARLGRGMSVVRRVFPHTAAARRSTPQAWLPDAPEETLFRSLALVAVDAAKQAGADFADVRIGVQRECSGSSARMMLGYGIRARVSGTWSFQHGNILTPDAVVAAARTAVAGARVAAAINVKLGRPVHAPFAAVPVVTGTWRGPVEIDPFTVPIDDFRRLEMSFSQTLVRLGFTTVNAGLQWAWETRVFASTDGSLVTQTFMRGQLNLGGRVGLPGDNDDGVRFDVLRPDGESAGFELLMRRDYADQLYAEAEEAIRWDELPEKRFDDVGRYPVVFDGAAAAAVLGQTVNFALDGDRLSGNESDASGRSFLQPFAAHPIQPPPEFSPLVTITSHCALPSSTAVGWDDDGVAPTLATLVDKGTVADFHVTRETAAVFGDWYARHGRTAQLHGRCVAPTPASLPMASGGDVRMAPSAATVRAEDLFHDIDHGFYVKGGYADAATNLSTGLLAGRTVIEVVRGKPVARISNLRMSFVTNALFKSGLVALGDATTLRTEVARAQKGMPWQSLTHPVTAPAIRCKEIDVLRTDLSR